MSPIIVNKKVTFPFAHEFEKSYFFLLAVVSTFGEVYVNATKRTYFSKTIQLFSSAISASMSAVT